MHINHSPCLLILLLRSGFTHHFLFSLFLFQEFRGDDLILQHNRFHNDNLVRETTTDRHGKRKNPRASDDICLKGKMSFLKGPKIVRVSLPSPKPCHYSKLPRQSVSIHEGHFSLIMILSLDFYSRERTTDFFRKVEHHL